MLAVGPGDKNSDGAVIAMNLAVNDTVFLPEYGGMKVRPSRPAA